MPKNRNPFAFTPIPVTTLILTTYILLAAILLYIHSVVPAAPKTDAPVSGVNLTEAWGDLQALTSRFHSYNSRANDDVRNWLLQRTAEILKDNNVEFEVRNPEASVPLDADAETNDSAVPVIIFNDMLSNTTFSYTSKLRGELNVYFEGSNILVYIKGSQDSSIEFLLRSDVDSISLPKSFKRGVLVNAHFDSVSTGYGATDDGVGVTTLLQLLRHYSLPENTPQRGIILLFNNGEEDYLNGARAFMKHPLSKLPDTFLNLEGAGAGGRAALFRSTDAEVTSFYKSSPHPFGSALSADGFRQGLVQSETDYKIFYEELGLRGLDVAFMEPRARYHTPEDSTSWTSRDSVWHMLSAALNTVDGLTSDTETQFYDDSGSDGVWFDMFGYGFGLLTLHALFAITVTLLVLMPLFMIALLLLLRRADKLYLFARKVKSNPMDPHAPDETTYIHFNGWRGIDRYPVALVLACAGNIALALLIVKVNPYIVYSSGYAVWTMYLSTFFFVSWFVLYGADYMRPTALQRAHSLGWMWILLYILLVGTAVAENQYQITGLYFLVIYFAAVSLALFLSYLEFFRLPTRRYYVRVAGHAAEDREAPGSRPLSSAGRRRGSSFGSGRILARENDGRPESSDRLRRSTLQGDDPTETTSLLGKQKSRAGTETAVDEDEAHKAHADPLARKPYGQEQAWSSPLPSWIWLLQFLAIGPIVLILVGQVGLLLTSGLSQTLVDGNSPMVVYTALAAFSILVMLPVTPFIHRCSSFVPTFLLLIAIGTTCYNIFAFPFSHDNRMKYYFVQKVDLDSGLNKVSIMGPNGYVQNVVAAVPSSTGQKVECSDTKRGGAPPKQSLWECEWSGLAPDVVPHKDHDSLGNIPPEIKYKDWINVTLKHLGPDTNSGLNRGIISVSSKESRACRLYFEGSGITSFYVEGSDAQHKVKGDPPYKEIKQVRLWSRTWNRTWNVHVSWANSTVGAEDRLGMEAGGLDGRVACLWSDANDAARTIPALHELMLYQPVWSIMTKKDDGLVEGSKAFML